MRKILLVWLMLMVFVPAVFAEGQKHNSLNNERLYQAVNQYVQESIQHFLVKTCGEVMQNVIVKQNMNLFPEIAYQASQQAAVQLFKQDDMRNLIWGIFDENVSQAKDEIDLGMPQAFIETGIKKRIERDINLIVDEPVFRYVIEVMMNQAMVQQQQIVMMAAAQQQAQLMAIRQQQMMMQQQIMQQIIQNQYR